MFVPGAYGGSKFQVAGGAWAGLAYDGFGHITGTLSSLAAGATTTIQYKTDISNTVGMGQTLVTSATATWESIPGALLGDIPV